MTPDIVIVEMCPFYWDRVIFFFWGRGEEAFKKGRVLLHLREMLQSSNSMVCLAGIQWCRGSLWASWLWKPSSVSHGLLLLSWTEDGDVGGGEAPRPRSLHGSPVHVAVVALPEAKSKRVEVEFAPAVVTQQLPLLLLLPQRETRVGVVQQEELLCTSPPKARHLRACGKTTS